jgi:hypothetical protein
MSLPREVMDDLLTIYLAGEGSPATRSLVEEYAREHPDYERLMRTAAAVAAASLRGKAPADHELEALQRARRRLRGRSLWFGAALAFSLVPLTVAFSGGRVVFWMPRDAPGVAAASLLAAAICWGAFLRVRGQVRSTGL